MRDDVPTSLPVLKRVSRDFDGHLERPLLSLTVCERLDWIWAGMELLYVGQLAREERRRQRSEGPASR